MANNNLNSGENILVKVDQNNVILIDPNSVSNGPNVEMRNVKQENLVMYVNLEADLVPRTTLAASGDGSAKSTLLTVAKGNLSFLRAQDGQDLNTGWTDSFFNSTEKTQTLTDKNGKKTPVGTGEFFQADSSGQSFGIESININVKGSNFIPQVNINFVDVRGKTLFESPNNTPYKAFFHLPWPIFYLTVKGYYGKAIRYRLHLTKFTSKYNGSNGNFDISTTFVGSTYAFLNDIPLEGILNAPYMYMIENDGKNSTFNTNTGTYQKKISKSSRGYTLLRTIYSEYKQKGLLPKNFPVKTLREVITIAKSLDNILEREIFDQKVDMKIFNGIKEFEKIVQDFESAVVQWGKKYLSNDSYTDATSKIKYYYLSGQNNGKLDNITNATDNKTLEFILTNKVKELRKTADFSSSYINKSGIDFKQQTFNFLNKIKDISKYYQPKEGKYSIAYDLLLSDIYEIQKSFLAQRDKLQKYVEEVMNQVIKDPLKGIGFKPTIRNIFGVIMANADVYIRLLKDVHTKAFEASSKRKDLVNNYSNESEGDNIYPWPEIRKITSNKQSVIAYPGDSDLRAILRADDKTMWPEVDFIENYQSVATKRTDPLAEKEGGAGAINYVFESNSPDINLNKTATLFQIESSQPYMDKSMSGLLYEIFERARYSTLLDSYNSQTIIELANNEFDNLQKILEEDFDIVDIMKTINSASTLTDYMLSFSPFDRYPYFQDKLPTIPYIKNLEEFPFKISQYNIDSNPSRNENYPKLIEELKNYQPESYRKSIYPFNSSLYLNYLNKTDYNLDDLNLRNITNVDTTEGLVSTSRNSEMWIKSEYTKNLFLQNFNITQSNGKTNILNTPYFHKQLYTDFKKSSPLGKYSGSAYLLLNSLPFKDLEDKVLQDQTRMSSLFKEIGASHYVPYHLILKWGSIYHRYKKKILDNVDILSGFLTNNITQPISGRTFFDNGSGYTYTTNNINIIYTGQTNVGLHPYYDSIFHQVVNNYALSDTGSTIFNTNLSGGTINVKTETYGDGIKYHTTFVNNSKTDPDLYKFYTLLPSVGGNPKESAPYSVSGYESKIQSSFRVVWVDDDIKTTDYSGETFPSYNQYVKSYVSGTIKTDDNKFGLGSDYRKVMDLIGTFSPSILDEFESCFIEFSTEKVNEEIPYHKFPPYTGTTKEVYTLKYDKFQDLLKEIVTVPIDTQTDPADSGELIKSLKTKQLTKLELITAEMLKADNLIKLTMGNPKEINPNVWYGLAKFDNVNTFNYGTYNLTTQSGYTNYVELYVGPYVSGTSINNEYLNFFKDLNIELSESNVLQFRPLILIYAGYIKNGGTNTLTAFRTYLTDNVLTKASDRLSIYLVQLIGKFSSLKTKENKNQLTVFSGFNDQILKLEEYNYFKTFNDKWVSGNSLGSRSLMEEFLFFDKANKDIGDVAYISLEKLLPLDDRKNDKANLYSVISMLIQGTGFDMRALPAYINFYGTNVNGKSKTTSSKKVAENLFGTFLDVDYQESSPKIIIQYTGPTSKRLELSDIEAKENKFKNDSGNLFANAQSPLVVTIDAGNQVGDLYKSNKVVAFEVSVGDENQALFKGVQLDQSSQRETTESMAATENLGRSESGAGVYQLDTSLFDIYRLRSYTCEVTMMGNVMIQPTMYFYLKNIPMFRGSYWITEVSHNIKPGNISTVFKGTRIPYTSLPDPKDSFLSSYRVLFDKITKAAQNRVKQENLVLSGDTKTEKILNTDNGALIIDMGDPKLAPKGEKLQSTSGVNEFGVNWGGRNGEKYIQEVEYNGTKYLRAIACVMGGKNYEPAYDIEMGIINRVTTKTVKSGVPERPGKIYWQDIKDDKKNQFYSMKFDLSTPSIYPSQIISAKTTFVNPNGKTPKTVIVKPLQIEKPTDNVEIRPDNIWGPIHRGPNVAGFGVALSKKLMTDLGLTDGQVVYFTMEKGY
jgi:hypothetical protein